MEMDQSNLLGSFVTFFDHGLLVLEDTSSKAPHDEWDAGSELIHVDEDSLYLAVCPAVDGPVTVSVYEDRAPDGVVDGLASVFSSALPLPSGSFTVADSDDRAKLTFRTTAGEKGVNIYVDEPDYASRVVIVIGN